jgi:DNA repair exonuclease SbcCD ATPase subunit
MNLLKLKTNNWRTFFGEHELTFSNEPGRHVTLIHGQNGSGKTTMLNAIKWCLYRKTPDFDKEINATDPIEIAHYDSWKNSGDGKFSVELRFEHEGIEYRATRVAYQKDMVKTLIRDGKDEFTLFMVDGRGSRLVHEPESTISSILPAELSDYFLFTGETVSKALSQGGHGYKQAVRDILGFTLSDVAIKDLEKILRKNTAKKYQLMQANKLTEKAGESLGKLTKVKEQLDEQIEGLSIEISDLGKAEDELNMQIQNSNHELAERLAKNIKAKEIELTREEKRRDGTLLEKNDLIQKYGFAVFGFHLSSNIDLLKTESNNGNLPAGVVDNFVNKLLDEHRCICDRELKEGSPEYNSVEMLLETANTSLIADRAQTAFSASDYFKGQAGKFISDLTRITEKLEVSESLVSSYIGAITENKSRLEGLGDTVINHILQEQNTVRTTKIAKIEDRQTKKVLVGLRISEIGKINSEIEKIKTDDPELELRLQLERVINVTLKRLKLNQKKLEEKSRQQITKNIQGNISDYLHRDYGALVDQDYNVSLTVAGTNTVAGGVGEGAEMLAKLSFITSLIAHSKMRKNAKSTWAAPGTLAPFVIDAPFANMDETYQKSTLSFLPQQSHQLILFLSNGQWQEDFEEVIGEYIGERYYYVNHVKPGKKITEKPLSIKGTEYVIEKNDWSKDFFGTTIEKIL